MVLICGREMEKLTVFNIWMIWYPRYCIMAMKLQRWFTPLFCSGGLPRYQRWPCWSPHLPWMKHHHIGSPFTSVIELKTQVSAVLF